MPIWPWKEFDDTFVSKDELLNCNCRRSSSVRHELAGDMAAESQSVGNILCSKHWFDLAGVGRSPPRSRAQITAYSRFRNLDMKSIRIAWIGELFRNFSNRCAPLVFTKVCNSCCCLQSQHSTCSDPFLWLSRITFFPFFNCLNVHTKNMCYPLVAKTGLCKSLDL